ncbi:hypothetical protein C0Q70_12336 [Pomacea canaliculata]|uniref:C-type lectin domain-containing protein n=1 Tax=Pomacea canaliculata TaxID=400727 RepID=A0A2T7P187_POMCA|nr:hypothetical protein C0Q70_12336 [Pomacea canaliculata]
MQPGTRVSKREDEGPHCHFSSPACNGSLSVRNKCYMFIKSTGYFSWSSVLRDCRKRGGNLPNVKTEQEQEALNKIYRYGKSPSNIYIGLSTYDGTLPTQYRNVLVWSDGTVAYNSPLTSLSGYRISPNSLQTYCFASDLYNSDVLLMPCVIDYQENRYDTPLCEFSLTNFVPQMSVLMPPINSHHAKNSSGYAACAEGHYTFDFLSCDKTSHCGAQHLPLYCETRATGIPVVTAMFLCLDNSNTLPYSLVCDFRLDCSDGSDENLCTRNQTCAGFRCLNGQCIASGKLCDAYKDCWDGSDENCDMFRGWLINATNFAFPPAVVDFSQQNDVIYKALNPSDPWVTTYLGTSYPLDVISSLTLLVGPVNAAVNPVLYAAGVLREARRKSRRLRLLKMLQSHCPNPHNLSISSLKITAPNLKR